jgi:hypothetical protein
MSTAPAIHGVGAGRLDAGPRDPGVDIAFADTDHALVGLHLNDDRVLVGARRVDVVGGIDEHVAANRGDLHAMTS